MTRNREFVVTFAGEEDLATVRLATGTPLNHLSRYAASTTRSVGDHYVNTSRLGLHPPEYHVFTSHPDRAVQIARAMRGRG
jgi:hypothetical protein